MARLDANKQAADYYLDAIEAFHEEIVDGEGGVGLEEGDVVAAAVLV